MLTKCYCACSVAEFKEAMKVGEKLGALSFIITDSVKISFDFNVVVSFLHRRIL